MGYQDRHEEWARQQANEAQRIAKEQEAQIRSALEELRHLELLDPVKKMLQEFNVTTTLYEGLAKSIETPMTVDTHKGNFSIGIEAQYDTRIQTMETTLIPGHLQQVWHDSEYIGFDIESGGPTYSHPGYTDEYIPPKYANIPSGKCKEGYKSVITAVNFTYQRESDSFVISLQHQDQWPVPNNRSFNPPVDWSIPLQTFPRSLISSESFLQTLDVALVNLAGKTISHTSIQTRLSDAQKARKLGQEYPIAGWLG
jgi:hypothetical protein